MYGENQALRVRLLGPLTVSVDQRNLTPTATKPRALLALLALHANSFVSTDCIVDTLWECSPPRSAKAALHGYVTAVRRSLAPRPGGQRSPSRTSVDSVLVTQPSGYLLRLDANGLDLIAFREQARLGAAALAAAEYEQAEAWFTAALREWNGMPLADLARVGMLSGYATRLTEERVQVTHNWVNALLGQGRGAEAVRQMEELCTSYPLREEFHRQLMLTLRQANRRADALAAYARAYRVLTTEAGIEPCPSLRATHRQLLDEELVPPALGWAELPVANVTGRTGELTSSFMP